MLVYGRAQSCCCVFIPKKYIPGNIYDDNSNIDCVFTTHTVWSMKCLDYASEYGIKHHYVMDDNIFE